MNAESEFLRYSITKLRQEFAHIEACVAKLPPEQLWQRGGESQNAIGNLLLHLTGNLRQWILQSVAGMTIQRDRDAEFAARSGPSEDALVDDLRGVINSACTVIGDLPDERLIEIVHVQGHDVSVLEAIYHVVEHFSGHTGQIILLTKSSTGSDLGFYGYLARPSVQ